MDDVWCRGGKWTLQSVSGTQGHKRRRELRDAFRPTGGAFHTTGALTPGLPTAALQVRDSSILIRDATGIRHLIAWSTVGHAARNGLIISHSRGDKMTFTVANKRQLYISGWLTVTTLPVFARTLSAPLRS